MKTCWNGRLIESYDQVGERYADRFFDELDNKPFDRELLDRFAETVSDAGTVCDLGCGPGQIARYLGGRGVDMMGIDLSPVMVDLGRRLNPEIPFQVGDMLALELPDASLAGIVAFYSLIHIRRREVPLALGEMHRVLVPAGQVLLAVHGGHGEIHAEECLGEEVSIDVVLFERGELRALAVESGFEVKKLLVRNPYAFEFTSERLYLWGSKA